VGVGVAVETGTSSAVERGEALPVPQAVSTRMDKIGRNLFTGTIIVWYSLPYSVIARAIFPKQSPFLWFFACREQIATPPDACPELRVRKKITSLGTSLRAAVLSGA
jgi:hypothetical protein